MMTMKLLNVQGIKKLCTILIVGLCAIGLSGALAHAATKKASFRVGVIDPQSVIEKSKAGKRALAGLKEHAQARQTVMMNDQKELERLKKDFEATQDKMSEVEKKREQDRLGQKFSEWQKRGQEFQQELGEKQKELVQEYMKKIQEATTIVAKRHGFDVVIDKGSENTLKIVLYHRNGLDLTNEVIKEFNKRFK